MLQLPALLLLLQIAIPAPRGYVNDLAGVLDAAAVSQTEAVIADVRAKTRGEIAVVTLPDIGDRSPSDVALQIGRQWGVGARGEVGDPAKNLGVVVLLVPLKDHRPGTGQIFIATGRGAEGFLPDARVGRIRDAMIPYLAQEEYGRGLAAGVGLIAAAFAQEFGVTITGAPVERGEQPPVPFELMWFVTVAIVLLVLGSLLSRRAYRRRGRWGGWIGGGWYGSRGGGWGGAGGGGFSGGFGGFGGGGGFSGGGAGGRF